MLNKKLRKSKINNILYDIFFKLVMGFMFIILVERYFYFIENPLSSYLNLSNNYSYPFTEIKILLVWIPIFIITGYLIKGVFELLKKLKY